MKPATLGSRLRQGLRRFVSSPRSLSAIGVIAAGILLGQVNVLVSRNYARFDVTRHGVYTLSNPTVRLLESVSEPLTVYVLMSRSDPMLVQARHLVDAYRAILPALQVKYVDPDHDVAEFLALQRLHGIAAGQTQDGRAIVDASFIVSSGDRHWFVSPDELISYDDEGLARPRLEAKLTEAIAHVVSTTREVVCFSRGHGELSPDDAGPKGLAELRRRLERSNFDVEVVYLDAREEGQHPLARCRAVIVAGPERDFSLDAATSLGDYLDRGGRGLFLLDPIIDDEGRVQRTGLEGMLASRGVRLGANFVIEGDPSRRLPRGLGEAFFAEPKTHPITEGLSREGEPIEARPLVIAAGSLEKTSDSSAVALLESSPNSVAVTDLRRVEAGGRELDPSATDAQGPFLLALSNELSGAPVEGDSGGPGRLVVASTSNVAWSENYRDPLRFGGRLFVENAISWLAERPALISVPDKETFPAGLTITEDALGEMQRYVLLYMPATAGLMGLFILLRRRRTERKSRRSSASRDDRSARELREPSPEQPAGEEGKSV